VIENVPFLASVYDEFLFLTGKVDSLGVYCGVIGRSRPRGETGGDPDGDPSDSRMFFRFPSC